MLSLQRRPGESIMIGDEVEITVVSVSGKQVKLAIAAPRSVKILRKELYLEKFQGVDPDNPEGVGEFDWQTEPGTSSPSDVENADRSG